MYNTQEDWYNIDKAKGVMNTADKNIIEILDSKKECLDRVVELGITLKKLELTKE